MSTRKLIVYPDPTLHQVSQPVTEFGTPELRQLIDDMYVVAVYGQGIGLSAIQVGVPLRIIILNAVDERLTLINPVVTMVSSEQTQQEGCLSVPGVYELRKRPRHIKVDFQDVDGNPQTREFFNIAAFCLLHEIDHLDGKLFIDELSPLKKTRARERIKKTLRHFRKDPAKNNVY